MPCEWRMLATWESTRPHEVSSVVLGSASSKGWNEARHLGPPSSPAGPPPPGIWAEESCALDPQRDPHTLPHRCPFNRVSPTSLGGFRRSRVPVGPAPWPAWLPSAMARAGRQGPQGHVRPPPPLTEAACSAPRDRKLEVLLRLGYLRCPVGRPGSGPPHLPRQHAGTRLWQDQDVAAEGHPAVCTSCRGRWPSGWLAPPGPGSPWTRSPSSEVASPRAWGAVRPRLKGHGEAAQAPHLNAAATTGLTRAWRGASHRGMDVCDGRGSASRGGPTVRLKDKNLSWRGFPSPRDVRRPPSTRGGPAVGGGEPGRGRAAHL